MIQGREGTDPIHDLVHEHEIISSVLDALEATVQKEELVGGFSPEFYDRALTFLSAFADRCHHEKEETHLFPEMERFGVPRDGGPIGCMLDEHEVGRAHIRAARAALGAAGRGVPEAAATVRAEASAYVRLLRGHILKENDVLFVIAKRVLPEAVLADLARRFESSEETVGGLAGHEKYVAMARELARTAGTARE